MKITAITTQVVNAQLRNWIFVRIETDVPGLYGLGEATLEFQTRAVIGAIDDLALLIEGEDPRNIEHLWQVMYRHPFFKGGIVTMSALSGIDQALHDLKAKDLGIPLWQLIGGVSSGCTIIWAAAILLPSMTARRRIRLPTRRRARKPTASRR